MKQNERILVYAVTGFLAIILVIAVIFGRDPAPAQASGRSQVDGVGAPGLGAVLRDQKGNPSAPDGTASPGAESTGAASRGASGVPGPAPLGGEQPLVASSRTLIAADLVGQQLGPSRRDRTVRVVHARAGDSLDTIVRRWCGSLQFLDEARSLNEQLTIVRLGQEVTVPWVEDEVVLAAHEARQPMRLVAEGVGESGAPGGAVLGKGAPATSEPKARTTLDSVLVQGKGATVQPTFAKPTFAQPGQGVDKNAEALAKNGGTDSPKPDGAKASPTTTYVVKSGDSLWKICERLYGRKEADRMVAEIKRLNAGKVERLFPDQKIVVPAATGGSPGAPRPGA